MRVFKYCILYAYSCNNTYSYCFLFHSVFLFKKLAHLCYKFSNIHTLSVFFHGELHFIDAYLGFFLKNAYEVVFMFTVIIVIG